MNNSSPTSNLTKALSVLSSHSKSFNKLKSMGPIGPSFSCSISPIRWSPFGLCNSWNCYSTLHISVGFARHQPTKLWWMLLQDPAEWKACSEPFTVTWKNRQHNRMEGKQSSAIPWGLRWINKWILGMMKRRKTIVKCQIIDLIIILHCARNQKDILVEPNKSSTVTICEFLY